MAVHGHRCLFLGSPVEFCRWAVVGGRAEPFLLKFVLLMLILVPRGFPHPGTFSSSAGGVVVSAPFWEMGDGAWGLPWLTHGWELLLLCAGALLGCFPREWALFPFPFQGSWSCSQNGQHKHLLPREAWSSDPDLTQHLFLTLAEAHRAERSSDLTHSFHQLFLVLSCLIAETAVSAISSVVCFTSNKVQEISWWRLLGKIQFPVGSSLEKSSSLGWQVWIWLRDIACVSFRECSYPGLWGFCLEKWGGVVLSRQDPQSLPNSPDLMFCSLFQFSLFLRDFHDRIVVIWIFWAGHRHVFVFACHFGHLTEMHPSRIFQYKCRRQKKSTNNFEGKKMQKKA